MSWRPQRKGIPAAVHADPLSYQDTHELTYGLRRSDGSAELPAAAAAPVTEVQPAEPPQQEGNAAADAPAKAAKKTGRAKDVASPAAPARQAHIDTILSKAKRVAGTAKSLAVKALSKVVELPGELCSTVSCQLNFCSGRCSDRSMCR